jgi:hypothetical protein
MKRSDMIQDIASYIIIGCCDNDISPMAYDKAQNIAELVLEKMENEGMTPPYTYNPIIEGRDGLGKARMINVNGGRGWELE